MVLPAGRHGDAGHEESVLWYVVGLHGCHCGRQCGGDQQWRRPLNMPSPSPWFCGNGPDSLQRTIRGLLRHVLLRGHGNRSGNHSFGSALYETANLGVSWQGLGAPSYLWATFVNDLRWYPVDRGGALANGRLLYQRR